jgi:surface polysaccharide O-acyltransferase-like enzyme
MEAETKPVITTERTSKTLKGHTLAAAGLFMVGVLIAMIGTAVFILAAQAGGERGYGYVALPVAGACICLSALVYGKVVDFLVWWYHE